MLKKFFIVVLSFSFVFSPYPRAFGDEKTQRERQQKAAFALGLQFASTVLLDPKVTPREIERALNAYLSQVQENEEESEAFAKGIVSGVSVSLFAIIRDFQIRLLNSHLVTGDRDDQKNVQAVREIIVKDNPQINPIVLRLLLDAFGPFSTFRPGADHYSATQLEFNANENWLKKIGASISSKGPDFSKVDFPSLSAEQKIRLNKIFPDPTQSLTFTERKEQELFRDANEGVTDPETGLTHNFVRNGNHIYLRDYEGETNRRMSVSYHEREVGKGISRINKIFGLFTEKFKEKVERDQNLWDSLWGKSGPYVPFLGEVNKRAHGTEGDPLIQTLTAYIEGIKFEVDQIHEKYGMPLDSLTVKIEKRRVPVTGMMGLMERSLRESIDVNLTEINADIQFTDWKNPYPWRPNVLMIPLSMYAGSLFMTKAGIGAGTGFAVTGRLGGALEKTARLARLSALAPRASSPLLGAANNAARLAAIPGLFSGLGAFGEDAIRGLYRGEFHPVETGLRTFLALRNGAAFSATMPVLIGILTAGASPVALKIIEGGLITTPRAQSVLTVLSQKASQGSLETIHAVFILLLGGNAFNEGFAAYTHYSKKDYEEAYVKSFHALVSAGFASHGAYRTWGLKLDPVTMKKANPTKESKGPDGKIIPPQEVPMTMKDGTKINIPVKEVGGQRVVDLVKLTEMLRSAKDKSPLKKAVHQLILRVHTDKAGERPVTLECLKDLFAPQPKSVKATLQSWWEKLKGLGNRQATPPEGQSTPQEIKGLLPGPKSLSADVKNSAQTKNSRPIPQPEDTMVPDFAPANKPAPTAKPAHPMQGYQEKVASLIVTLRTGKTPEARIAAAKELGESGAGILAVPQLFESIKKDPDFLARIEYLRLIGEVPAARGMTQELLTLLSNAWKIKEPSIFVRLQGNAEGYRQVKELYLLQLIQTLGKIGNDSALMHLKVLEGDSTATAEVRSAAGKAIEQILARPKTPSEQKNTCQGGNCVWVEHPVTGERILLGNFLTEKEKVVDSLKQFLLDNPKVEAQLLFNDPAELVACMEYLWGTSADSPLFKTRIHLPRICWPSDLKKITLQEAIDSILVPRIEKLLGENTKLTNIHKNELKDLYGLYRREKDTPHNLGYLLRNAPYKDYEIGKLVGDWNKLLTIFESTDPEIQSLLPKKIRARKDHPGYWTDYDFNNVHIGPATPAIRKGNGHGIDAQNNNASWDNAVRALEERSEKGSEE